MIETITEYNTFWLIIFSAITIIAVGGILGIVIIKLKNKDADIFFKSSDNAKDVTIDTTDKMKDMHDKVVEFTPAHEKELDYIEKKIDKIEKDIIEINEKLDAFIQKVIELEKRK